MTIHPMSQTLLTVLDNQHCRIEAALEGVTDEVFQVEPGGDCHSILGVGRHLVQLRRFQLLLLGSPLASRVADPESVGSLAELIATLDASEALLREAITAHDPDDWLADPLETREGPWGDEPTLHRFVRPLNDLTNHLGAIRAIRRMHGSPAERTQ